MDDLTDNLSKNFGVSLKKSLNVRDGLLISNSGGSKLLKKTDATHKKIVFSHSVKEYLYSNGYKYIDRYKCSIEGKPYVELNGNTYVMTDTCSQDHHDVDFETNDLNIVFEALATIHTVIKGFEANGYTIEPPLIKDYYIKRKRELTHIKKWILEQSKITEFDWLILKNFPNYIEKTDEAIMWLESSAFANLLEKTVTEKIICHNTFREENIKIGNQAFVSSFENSFYNHYIFDLSELIHRYIKKSSATPQKIFNALESYTKINPLSNEEMKMLFQKIKFPDKFLKLANQHYNKRRSWVSQALIKSMESALAQQQKKDDIMNECLKTL